MDFIYGTCAQCGTQTITDPETEAEVHFDVAYKGCGVEGELQPLLDHIEGRGSARTTRLKVVR